MKFCIIQEIQFIEFFFHFQCADLEESMTDALINDKPQFVRLFCENGLNMLDYLTYGRLESLYRSLSDSSLAYILLQRRLSERQDVAGPHSWVNGAPTPVNSSQCKLTTPASMKDLSLFEVMTIFKVPECLT